MVYGLGARTSYPRMSVFPRGVGVRIPRAPSLQISPGFPRYPGLPTNLVRGFRFTYVPNYFGIFSLARHIGVNRALGYKASRIALVAKSIAPVRTGEYRDSIGTSGNRVYAAARHSKYVEFGTGDTPVFAPLRRAADAETFGWKGGGEL